jgi:hypothetical protein
VLIARKRREGRRGEGEMKKDKRGTRIGGILNSLSKCLL